VSGVISGFLVYILKEEPKPSTEVLKDIGEVDMGGGNTINIQKIETDKPKDQDAASFQAQKVVIPLPVVDGNMYASLTADTVTFTGFDKPMILNKPVLTRFNLITGKMVTKTTSDMGKIVFTQKEEGTGFDSVQLSGNVKISQYEPFVIEK